MFRLVGDETFYVGDTKCVVRVAPSGSFAYEYSLLVNGQRLDKFVKAKSKTCCTWLVDLPAGMYRVVLGKVYIVNKYRSRLEGEGFGCKTVHTYT